MAYLYLAIAILSEVMATVSLKASEQFSRFFPTIIVLIGYLNAFYFLSLSLRSIPIGSAYAIWSGFGMVLVSVSGYFVYKQKLDFPAIVGIFFILLGVLILTLFSKTTPH